MRNGPAGQRYIRCSPLDWLSEVKPTDGSKEKSECHISLNSLTDAVILLSRKHSLPIAPFQCSVFRSAAPLSHVNAGPIESTGANPFAEQRRKQCEDSARSDAFSRNLLLLLLLLRWNRSTLKLCLEHLPSVRQLQLFKVYPELHHSGSFAVWISFFYKH